MIKVIVFTILYLTLSASSVHKYYTSITQIEWNGKAQSAEVIINVFIDDLEKALTEQNKHRIIYGANNFNETAFNYVSLHFKLNLSTGKTKIKPVGIQLSKDIASIYLEVENVKTLNNCTIKNDMLTDIIDTQTNMINVIEDTNKKTLILSKSHGEETVRF